MHFVNESESEPTFNVLNRIMNYRPIIDLADMTSPLAVIFVPTVSDTTQ